jgi:hypothetical protein
MSVGVRWGRSIIVVRRRFSERSEDDSRRESVERSEELTAGQERVPVVGREKASLAR